MTPIEQALSLSRAPIGVAFLAAVPEGLPRWQGPPQPAGCAFWKEAMAGASFYTVPEDHFHCAVGAYTHGIPIPEERGAVLQDTVGFMVGQGYIQIAEVPAIPVMAKRPAAIAYGPVSGNAFRPDVVIVAAKPSVTMLLYEAAVRAGAGDALTRAMGRPGCAVVPLTAGSGAASLSFGCKGNRTYTGLPDEELYFAVPGDKWPSVASAVEAISAANGAMETYYRNHAQKVAAS